MGLLGLKCMPKSIGVAWLYYMLKVCDGCKDGLDTDKDGSSISTKWGCARPISC